MEIILEGAHRRRIGAVSNPCGFRHSAYYFLNEHENCIRIGDYEDLKEAVRALYNYDVEQRIIKKVDNAAE
jgi:hypothetical protein